MDEERSVLSPAEVRSFYDRFGSKLDSQGFYENPALAQLIAHGRFAEAGRVFEFGCGTGKFAELLLAQHLPPTAVYLGCDLSPAMTALAALRLEPFGGRAGVVRTDGRVRFPLVEASVDRVVSSYVLDLLCAQDAREVFAEAHRVLRPGGLLCLASLAPGVNLPSRLVARLWMALFRLRASLVGGCRPIRLGTYAQSDRWQVEYQRVVTPFAVPSEVLILRAKAAATGA